MINCVKLCNFNPARLPSVLYPIEDRPRGQQDIESVLHHRRTIRAHGHTEPIWIVVHKGQFTLLDGALLLLFWKKKRSIQAYIIDRV